MINAYKILLQKSEKNKSLGDRRRWEKNIKIDLKEILRENMDWIHLGLGEEPVVGSYKHSNEPLGSIKFGEFIDNLSDSLLVKQGSVPWSNLQ
jgi:hypothetical protein